MKFLFAMLSLLLLAASISAQHYSASIYAPAVISVTNGTLTQVTVNISSGNGQVVIKGPVNVGASTQQSGQTAAQYAFAYTGMNLSLYNVTYFINDTTGSVSGPSGGLALTLLTISALEKKPLNSNFTVTGTINPDGSVGLIGGVYNKAEAAKAGNLKYMLVPFTPPGSLEYLLYYVSQQNIGIPLIEVANVSQAAAFAFGKPTITALTLNMPPYYKLSSLPRANVTCTGCNFSEFANLTNFTIEYVSKEINVTGSGYVQARATMLGMLSNYSSIASKGYLYTGADLAFLEYPAAFTMANSRGLTLENARTELDSISSYCTSLTAPQITSQNYEYVIGGQLRQSWGELTINSSLQVLNSSESIDGILTNLYNSASAYAWCSAASKMYSVAASIGGTPVGYPPNIRNEAQSELNNLTITDVSLYTTSARMNYNEGNYGAVLYALDYDRAFAASAGNNASSTEQKIGALLVNSTHGVWPSQFAAQADFYLSNAQSQNSSAQQGSIASAYAVALLASGLDSTNRQLAASFVYNVTGSQIALQISQLNQSIQNLYSTMLAILIVLIIILIMQLLQFLPKSSKPVGRRTHRR